MVSAIFKWIFEHWPTVGVFIGTISLVIWLCYKIFKFYFTRFSKVEREYEKIKSLEDTAQLNNDIITRIEKSLDEKLIPKLDNAVTSMNSYFAYLKGKDSSFDSSVFVVKSPVELSPLGIRLLENFGGKSYVDSHISELVKVMEQSEMKSALDVQIQAALAIIKKHNDDSFTDIKNFIYNNPIYREDGKDLLNLNLENVSQIMGIYLRNKYFELHPELKDIESEPKKPGSK